MADVTIRFKHNPKTGKRELLISYDSEEDALPHEHERDHRALVEKVLGRAIGDDETIVVERVKKEAAPTETAESAAAAQRQAQSNKNG
jgi:hypothetical protein